MSEFSLLPHMFTFMCFIGIFKMSEKEMDPSVISATPSRQCAGAAKEVFANVD